MTIISLIEQEWREVFNNFCTHSISLMRLIHNWGIRVSHDLSLASKSTALTIR